MSRSSCSSASSFPGYLGGSSTAASTTTTTTTTPGAPATPSITPVAVQETSSEPAKLSSFTAFSRKDPFVQQVKTDLPVASAPAPASKPQGGAKPGVTKGTTGKFTVGGKAATAVTIVSVNGARQALSPGAAFPASDPVFVLVAEKPEAKAVVIGVKGGAYASGASTTTLKVGKSLTLVNTTTGARYKLVLVSVGTGEAAVQPGGGAPTGKP